ncbi:MAG: bifunctional transaldolase/phosoglucose isomerase [Anaerolineales bacterium]|nr:bifunctional transaldolase/phosoglucose isomerase [Anaerolineales bacterium]
MTKVDDLYALGQSVWYDNIRRALLDSGELKALIDAGVKGVTSNPSIFEKAIAGSRDYDEELHRLVDEGKSLETIYETLALEDIRRTADLLRPIYEETEGVDGYVSLEVSPTLAHDTDGTVEEARRLFDTLDRPNVMIKVPATRAGLPAIETLIGEGINVNVTLIFSIENYEQVVKAYQRGLARLALSGGDLSRVASVASFFVSRVDSAVDQEIEALGEQALLGKIAIANAKVAYERFGELFRGERWRRLVSRGARVQRPLWASTSTKNPLYVDTLYVDSLAGPDTVNTIPPATLQAFLDHGMPSRTIDEGLNEAHAQLERLSALGVDLDAITIKLQEDGVRAFTESFEALMASIAVKRERLLAGWEHMAVSLGKHQSSVDEALRVMAENQILPRIWKNDHTVWKHDPTEISNRLGWLHSPEVILDNLHRLDALVEGVRREGYSHVLLLGMGGSSLAPEVLRKTFGVERDYLDLAVLDSTDPGAVLGYADQLDLEKTLFLVATKSGGTVETLSFFKFFYNQTAELLGEAAAGDHFVAITDPGSQLAELAEWYRFRATFLNDPNIGGRYSALSYFGLVPAALIGVDVHTLLDRALAISCGCESCVDSMENPGAQLGAILGELAKNGRDKLTLVLSSQIESFGHWIEQLVAESTGKEGKGILPVVGEPLGTPGVYGSDRLFVVIQIEGDEIDETKISALQRAGHPVVRLNLHDRYDLGGQFFLWELATAIAGQRLGINPFDQPNVEAAKVLARKLVAEYTQTGALPEGESSELTADSLKTFLETDADGDPDSGQGHRYVALQAYVQPTPETDAALSELRTWIREETRMATTIGYGPRFLHSTGQLHKGDGGRGLFIQFTAEPLREAKIPDEVGSRESAITFGVLKNAQALGDRRALIDAGRRVITFHLDGDVPGNLKKLVR